MKNAKREIIFLCGCLWWIEIVINVLSEKFQHKITIVYELFTGYILMRGNNLKWK